VENNKERAFRGYQVIINYCLNKFCPFIIVAFLVFSKFNLTTWEPYVIMGMVLFIERFSFKVGYSVAYCERRGIDVNAQND
jgi:hypothetical protein